ncbi:hypothetical protein ACFPVX_08680 [Cohnella faecalis]|uniref:hypothetical protein n=1 Tax=Cohnella faecalis TaxID=2315694 RepID=UPI0011C24099|nr:hypothetical protein [Cohnella faecalis]
MAPRRLTAEQKVIARKNHSIPFAAHPRSGDKTTKSSYYAIVSFKTVGSRKITTKTRLIPPHSYRNVQIRRKNHSITTQPKTSPKKVTHSQRFLEENVKMENIMED